MFGQIVKSGKPQGQETAPQGMHAIVRTRDSSMPVQSSHGTMDLRRAPVDRVERRFRFSLLARHRRLLWQL
jgi:hypothetical protein